MSAPVEQARLLVGARKGQAALTVLTPYLATNPDDPNALSVLAQAFLQLGDGERALEAASRAATLAPHNDWPLRLVATANVMLKRYDDARGAANRGRAVAPDQWRTHLVCAQVDVAAARVGRDSWDAAAEAVRLAPDQAQTHRMLGSVAYAMGEWATADRALREALRLDPQDAAARNELGRVQLKQRNLGAAAEGFAAAVRLDPTMDIAAHNLAVVAVRGLRIVQLVLWLPVVLALQLDGGGAGAEPRLARLGAAGLACAAIIVFLVLVHRQSGGNAASLLQIVVRRDRLVGAWGALLLVELLALIVAAFAGSAIANACLVITTVTQLLAVLVIVVLATRMRRRRRSSR